MATTALAAPEGGAVTTLTVRSIAPGGTNPRKHFDATAMAELVASVKAHGVLQPVLLRPWPAERPRGEGYSEHSKYELIAGERRWRAAIAADLVEIPALVRELTDDQVLEIQVVENLQRQDLHALEECDGYMRLRRAGYDVARIAERVGRSVAYVYDRLRLANLTDQARELFAADRIHAGHAVLLARLDPAQQELALLSRDGVFQDEHTLFDPREELTPRSPRRRDEDPFDGKKARSVKELQAWIDKNVRLDFEQPDLEQLFPDVAEAVAPAAPDEDEPRKVVQITQDHYVQPTARDGSRIIGPRSWKPATKPCDHVATGVIVVGPGRGEAFPVCVAKQKCRVHWGAEIRAREKAHKAVDAANDAAGKKGAARERDWQSAERARQDAENARREAARAVWEKARKEIDEALAAALEPMAAPEMGSFLADTLKGYNREIELRAARLIPPGGADPTTILRHLTLLVLLRRAREWDAAEAFPKLAKKLLGLDLKPIVARHTPPPAPAASKAAPATIKDSLKVRKGKGRARG